MPGYLTDWGFLYGERLAGQNDFDTVKRRYQLRNGSFIRREEVEEYVEMDLDVEKLDKDGTGSITQDL